jgi:hypothetical protein
VIFNQHLAGISGATNKNVYVKQENKAWQSQVYYVVTVEGNIFAGVKPI